MLESKIFINRLSGNLNIFRDLTDNISEDQRIWKPEKNKWSILEVMHHLYDEEKEDFRIRLEFTLSIPQKDWIPIDPKGWVVERQYNNQNFSEIINKFINEREKSIKWLKALNQPDWNASYRHPKIGKISAGDLLVSWVAHDFLHMRQINKLNLDYYQTLSNPYNMRYAMP